MFDGKCILRVNAFENLKNNGRMDKNRLSKENEVCLEGKAKVEVLKKECKLSSKVYSFNLSVKLEARKPKD